MRDTATPALGLCMIVKDEAHIFRRCLDAALPLLDYLLVVDTGSTDGTPDLVRAFLSEHHLASAVLTDSWRDFASNRNVALDNLQVVESVDYVLMLDADDLLVLDPGLDVVAWKQGLKADVYDVALRCGTVVYSRPQLFRNQLGARFRGVLHEYLVVPDGVSRAAARGIRIEAIQDGARNRNPRKYSEDARVLAEQPAARAIPHWPPVIVSTRLNATRTPANGWRPWPRIATTPKPVASASTSI